MRPAFAPGDLLVLRPEPLAAVHVGQIVTYAIPVDDRHVESHRVVSVSHRDGQTIVRTKGDANSAADPWSAALTGTRAWYVAGDLKGDGAPLLALRSGSVRLALMYGAPALLVLFGLARIWRPEHVQAV
jgi:signal peptidase